MSALGQIILHLTTTLTLGTAPAPAADMHESLLTLSVAVERVSSVERVEHDAVRAVTTVPGVTELPEGWVLTADGRYVPRDEVTTVSFDVLGADPVDAFTAGFIERDDARRSDVTARIDPLED